MIRAVIDTSVLIRYLIKPSQAIRELIETWWLDGRLCMVTAPELLEELVGVLERGYVRALVASEEARALLDTIALKADILPPLGEVPPFTRDPKDDKFVACALAGQADYVISLDKDVLSLGVVGEVRMLAPHQFVRLE